jgi:hypothetical protein
MAYSDPSAWNPSKSAYGTGVSEPTGITDKQRDMSTARNPMNSNQMNTVEDKNLPKQAEKPLPQQANPQAAEQTQAEVQKMRSTMGGAAYKVQGLVNKFLQEGTEQAKVKSGMKTVFDPVSGKYVVENANPEDYDVSAAVQEKMGQINAIREASQPLFEQDVTGQWRAKSMPNAMKGAVNYSNLPSEQQRQVDELIGIAGMINEYEKQGQGNSAQSLALREQLKTLDKTGVVSGMYKAIDEYQKFAGTGVAGDDSGMKWYGDKADTGLDINDILSMDTTKLESELRNSIVTGSGIFGGDYESGLRRQIDLESAEAKAAAEEETGYRNKLLEASQSYFKGNRETLQQSAADIQNAFKKALPDIMAQLGDTPSGQAARDFFTELSTTDSKSFGQLVDTLLNDPNSGLATEQRKALRGMLGDLAGGGSDQGQIQNWIDDLATQGYVTVADANGDEQKVDFDAEQKFAILQALQTNDESTPDKIKQIFDAAMHSTQIGTSLEAAIEQARVGNTQEAVAGFAKSLAGSLATFATSKTEDAVRQSLGISDADWKNMDPDSKGRAISAALASPEGKSLLMDSVKMSAQVQENAFKKTMAEQKEKLDQYNAQLATARDTLLKTQQNIQAKDVELQDYVRGQLSNFIVSKMSANVATYMDYFEAYSQQYDAMGMNAQARQTAAQALSYRDAMISMRDNSPQLWAAIYKGSDIESFLTMPINSAVAVALEQNRGMAAKLKGLFDDLLTNKSGQIDTIIQQVPTLANKRKEIAGLISQSNSEMAKLDALIKKVPIQQKQIDDMGKSPGATVFSPDEISKLALTVGQNIEKKIAPPAKATIDMGRNYQPASIKDLGNLLPEVYQTTSTSMPEIDGALLPDTGKTNMAGMWEAPKSPVKPTATKEVVAQQIPPAITNILTKALAIPKNDPNFEAKKKAATEQVVNTVIESYGENWQGMLPIINAQLPPESQIDENDMMATGDAELSAKEHLTTGFQSIGPISPLKPTQTTSAEQATYDKIAAQQRAANAGKSKGGSSGGSSYSGGINREQGSRSRT